MKKVLYILVPVLFFVIISYLLPNEKATTETVSVPMPVDAVTRVMTNQQEWGKWFPGSKSNDTTYMYYEAPITIHKVLMNGFKGTMINKDMEISLDFSFIAGKNARTDFTLNTVMKLSYNPILRFKQFLSLNAAEDDSKRLLYQIQDYFSDVLKVYGYPIEMQKVPNSSYVSTKQTYDHEPTSDEIYALIDEVNEFIAGVEVKIVNFPIMNVFKEDSTNYTLMVAVATERDIPSSGKFMLKNMMLGNIVVCEVTGDKTVIQKCNEAVKNYVQDYRKTSPAISFERLITNRRTIRDSTKWRTTINYPVFQ
ncbi:hypothetical protein [Sediminibacterium sp.]|uniref:hypothetical protein n=1 Tax=Sediminibacterium sp. TaxID=1917865 RepID=UPI0025FE8532|nr:hypothetical protein [Sediminibacterium sp.]MBT9484693.1 hypothetical protein [Sediminibacterium sp.]